MLHANIKLAKNNKTKIVFYLFFYLISFCCCAQQMKLQCRFLSTGAVIKVNGSTKKVGFIKILPSKFIANDTVWKVIDSSKGFKVVSLPICPVPLILNKKWKYGVGQKIPFPLELTGDRSKLVPGFFQKVGRQIKYETLGIGLDWEVKAVSGDEINIEMSPQMTQLIGYKERKLPDLYLRADLKADPDSLSLTGLGYPCMRTPEVARFSAKGNFTMESGETAIFYLGKDESAIESNYLYAFVTVTLVSK